MCFYLQDIPAFFHYKELSLKEIRQPMDNKLLYHLGFWFIYQVLKGLFRFLLLYPYASKCNEFVKKSKKYHLAWSLLEWRRHFLSICCSLFYRPIWMCFSFSLVTESKLQKVVFQGNLYLFHSLATLFVLKWKTGVLELKFEFSAFIPQYRYLFIT
jgi:hypothetical protein